MSDLQVALIILGGFIIAGVVGYNWLQERKLRDNITEEFIVPKKDVLVEEFYVDTDAFVDKEFEGDPHKEEIINKLNEDDIKKEPSIDKKALPELDTQAQQSTSSTENVTTNADDIDDTVALSPSGDDESLPDDEANLSDSEVYKNILPAEFHPIATSALPGDVHSQIDLTAFLYASKNIIGKAIHDVSKTTLKEMGAVIFCHGLDDNDIWHVIDDKENMSYKQVAYSIQLADRRGPVPKPVLNKFQYAVETIGLEFNAHVEWQGNGDPANRAADLDKFCMDVDQLVSVHLMQGDIPIHGTKFKGMAEAEGMQLKHSKFCYFDNSSSDDTSSSDFPKFILINADDQPFTTESLRTDIVRGATFQIEIPKVKNCEQAFNEMIAIAQKMANSLGARMVDDNQKPLGDLQIEKIRQQLKVIHATMVARAVMPGSTSSLRLFN